MDCPILAIDLGKFNSVFRWRDPIHHVFDRSLSPVGGTRRTREWALAGPLGGIK